MKLYLLSQDENNDYDTFDSCIVCAENETEAKNIHPRDVLDSKYNELDYSVWTSNLDAISCVEIGIANEAQKKGVILASFNAG